MGCKFENVEYSKELDEELKLLLQEYREGNLKVSDLIKLVDTACKDHLDFRENGELHARQSDHTKE